MSEKVQLAIHKGPDAEIEMGDLRFNACRREIGDADGGVTLRVFHVGGGEEVEVLRFDCFRNRPHYHAPGENQKETEIDVGELADSREWVYQSLSTSLSALLNEGGFDDLAERLDLVAFERLPRELRGMVEGLEEPCETSYFEVDASILEGLRDGAN